MLSCSVNRFAPVNLSLMAGIVLSVGLLPAASGLKMFEDQSQDDVDEQKEIPLTPKEIIENYTNRNRYPQTFKDFELQLKTYRIRDCLDSEIYNEFIKDHNNIKGLEAWCSSNFEKFRDIRRLMLQKIMVRYAYSSYWPSWNCILSSNWPCFWFDVLENFATKVHLSTQDLD